MCRPADYQALQFDGVITELARKRCRLTGIELDDLIQEARMEAWIMLMKGETPTEQDFVNAMRRWMRAIRAGKGVIYEDVQHLPRD